MLETTFVGLPLTSPIVVGSCPATESLDAIRRAEDAGAGAVITKSMGSHPSTPFGPADRRRYRWVPRLGMLMQSSYLKEILSRDQGVELIRRASTACAIPIIASVFHPGWDGEGDFERWRSLCRAAEAAGAAAIQLDFFYLDFRKLTTAAVRDVRNRIDALVGSVRIPVVPKLSIDMDGDLIDAIAAESRAPGLVYLDSIRTEPYIDIYARGRPLYDGEQFRHGRSRTVLAGESLLPFTLSLTQRLRRRTRRDLAAGGGLATPDDIVRCLMLGAQCVHVSSFLMRRGPAQITALNERLRRFLATQGYARVADVIGISYVEREGRQHIAEAPFVDRIARFIGDRCTGCGRCEELTVCRSFRTRPYEFVGNCDGCSMCVAICPPHALELVDMGGGGAGAP
jgi:dihydropyrimidine dehydrogenase (NAD+) subunit PreA